MSNKSVRWSAVFVAVLALLGTSVGAASAANAPTPTATSLPASPGATSTPGQGVALAGKADAGSHPKSGPEAEFKTVTEDGLVVGIARRIPYMAVATAVGTNGLASATLPLPTGLVPVVLTGKLTSVADSSGVVRIRVGTSYVTMDATLGGTFSIPISKDAIENDTVTVEVRNTLDPGPGECEGDFTTTETISDLVLGFIGRETPPSTIAGFFSPPVQHVTLVTPAVTTIESANATLAAASAIARRYDRTVPIDVVQPSEFAADPHALDDSDGPNRIVRLVVTDAKKVTVTVDNPGVPTMTLSGPSPLLSDAAAALASTGLKLAAVPEATKLEEVRRPQANSTITLADLGQPRPTVNGIGRLTFSVGIPQDQFGTPINQVKIHLEGTHVPVAPGGATTASVLWNDTLVEAQQLTDKSAYVADATVDGSLIRRANTLTLILDVVPPGGECGMAVQPMRLDLNGTRSTVAAVPGQSLAPGFDRFPQAFGNSLYVGFGSGLLTSEILDSACALVISLQRAASKQLNITTQDFSTFLNAPYPGLLVGATPADAQALKAPLRYEDWRSVNNDWTDFSITVDGPFAALEAFETDGRNILMLGGTDPVQTSQPLSNRLADEAQNGEFGWFGLHDSVLVAQPSGPLVYVNAETLVPQVSVTQEGRKLPPWWIFLIVGIVVLFLVRWWMLRRRKKRLGRMIAEGQLADSDGHPVTQAGSDEMNAPTQEPFSDES